MEINIGMTHEGLTAFRDALTEKLAQPVKNHSVDITLYAADNANTSKEIIININNDDMENDENSASSIFVEFSD